MNEKNLELLIKGTINNNPIITLKKAIVLPLSRVP